MPVEHIAVRLIVRGLGYAREMDKDKEPQYKHDHGDSERRPVQSATPRGNPETDRDAVAKGQEQLEKVSGN